MAANASRPPGVYHCAEDARAAPVALAMSSVHTLVLVPVSLLVLCLGLRRRRRSHSDVFAFHSAAMELLYALGMAVHLCGRWLGPPWLEMLGFYATSNLFCGQTSLHCLTCVERYLAAVHPVAYLALRRFGGVRIRNVSLGCVWLLYCGWVGVSARYYPGVPYAPFACLMAASALVVSGCSLAVLAVLLGPGPGRRGDQARRRAFCTVTAITLTLWLNVLGLLVAQAVDESGLLSYEDGCVVLSCGYVATLPSTMVLPLLFLQRAQNAACCCSS